MAKCKAHGQWECCTCEVVKSESFEYMVASARCSRCGRWCEQVPGCTGKVDYEFCPNCGCCMKEDINNG